MFDKLFGKEMTPEEQRKALSDYQREQERLEKLANMQESVFEKAEEFFDEEKLERQAPKESIEKITLNQAGWEFDSNGLLFSSFLVSDVDSGNTIDVDWQGLRYSFTLESGINQLNLMEGSILKSVNPIVVGLIRSNKQAKIAVREKIIVEAFNGTGNLTKTFSRYCNEFVITNDDATNSLTVLINGITITVKANEVFSGNFAKFKNVQITTTGSYRAYGRA
jgi:hypothetical protein